MVNISHKMKEITQGLQPTPLDNRDFKVGALFQLPKVDGLPDNFILEGYRIKDQIANGDDDLCSAYMSTGMSELQENVELSPRWSFAASKAITKDPEQWGQNLRAAMKAHVSYGAIEKKEEPNIISRIFADWPTNLLAKATAHKKQTFLNVSPAFGLDAFDTIRATLYKFQDETRAIGTGVDWGWSLKDKFLKTIKTGYGHAMYIVGWKTIKGEIYAVYVNSAGLDAGDNGVHYMSRNVLNHFVDKYQAFMFVDMPREKVQYMLDNGIKEGDNWIVQLWKVITTIVVSPFLNTEEKKSLLDTSLNILNNMKPKHPVKGFPITQKYGVYNSRYSKSERHIGCDYATPLKTPVLAPANGEIIVSGWHDELGYFCYYRYNVAEQRFTDRYLHLSKAPKLGKYQTGDTLALTGNTGDSSNPHIHIDCWKGDVHTDKIDKNNWSTLTVNPELHYK